MFDEAERRVYGELREQALAVETPVAPGEPTLRGWLRAMIDRIAMLEARVEELESGSRGE